ncbi:MAG TPA: lysylphosphatidylglycerol synthase domain-containing protein [Chitinophagaceae bacterium]|nr:lysylphosphatidylglycerol synthase domain-containing protein [Chitinophagaceae bacterium]
MGPLLFAWLSYAIYQQLRHQTDLAASWAQVKRTFGTRLVWNLWWVLGLMLVNWGLEAWKWQLVTRPVQSVSFLTAFKAVLSGLSVSVSTPNRMGEYLGRVLYMEEGNRLRTISLTILSSMSQLIITLAMGGIGLVCLLPAIYSGELVSAFWVRVLLYTILAGLAALTLFYFRMGWLARWVSRLGKNSKYVYLLQAVGAVNATLLWQLLSLSLLRFVVFATQYYLLFSLFGVSIAWWQSFWAVSILFLVLAILPTIALVEVVQRGTVALKIFRLLTANELGVGLTTVSIWFINLILPALVGSLLILSIKIFRSKHESV